MNKPDKELLKIWKKKEYSTRYFWMYNQLSSEEKSRLFDLLLEKGAESRKNKLYNKLP